jgi:ADP-heptose:LPS heptosyltransferase
MRPLLQRGFNYAKQLQRRYYAADYEEATLRRGWVEKADDAPYEERVFALGPDPADVASVLVFKPDEIGDAVYALPAAAELKRAFPGARLSLLCQELTEPLYARSGLFDEIVAVRPGLRFNRPQLRLDEALARFSERRFDVAVFLRTYPAYFRQFRALPATVHVHPVDPRLRSTSVHRADISLWSQERRHQSLQLLEIVGRLTGRQYSFADVAFPGFTWTAEDKHAPRLAFGAATPESYVVVHPFAKHETRQYPLTYWPDLLGRLAENSDARLVIVGGPGDPQLDVPPSVIQTQGQLSLSQTGYLTSRAAGFLGVLSGPAHWAAAMGTPTVTIMSGHSLPVEWAPLGRSLVLRADVPCAPCHQPTCPVYGLACLTALTPVRIAPKITAFFAAL